MSKKIQLDSRLSAIADFVKPNSIVADIGCDHGYLICHLVKTGHAKRGFACDANPQPLNRAKNIIRENCLFESIDTVLTNGLTGLPYSVIDTFIIAGMGGNLISEILLTHAWTRDSRFHFILQPMSKVENLRKAIYKNGFTITKETIVISDNKLYTVMSVCYTDRFSNTATISFYTGCLLDNNDFLSKLYLERTVIKLEKKSSGLLMSKNAESAKKYSDLAAEIRERIKLMENKPNKLYNVINYYDALNELAAFSLSESWDNTGILIGSPKTNVNAALVALDVTSAVIAEAKLLHANLIITHHPIIFPSVSHIDGNSLLHNLISENICVISAHTNYDNAQNGVNDTLGALLGLKNIRPLQNAESTGLGRLGDLPEPLQSGELAVLVKNRLNVDFVKYTKGGIVSTVAVCGGSGASLWRDAYEQGAQALITAEIKHNQFIEAGHAGFTLIDAGHYATEVAAMKSLASRLSKMLIGASIALSQAQSDPAFYL